MATLYSLSERTFQSVTDTLLSLWLLSRQDIITSFRYVESCWWICVSVWLIVKAPFIVLPRHWSIRDLLIFHPDVYFLPMAIVSFVPIGCSVRLLPKCFIGMIYTVGVVFKGLLDDYWSYRSVWLLDSLTDKRPSVLLLPSTTSTNLSPIFTLTPIVIFHWFLMYRHKQHKVLPID